MMASLIVLIGLVTLCLPACAHTTGQNNDRSIAASTATGQSDDEISSDAAPSSRSDAKKCVTCCATGQCSMANMYLPCRAGLSVPALNEAASYPSGDHSVPADPGNGPPLPPPRRAI
jgi:hypothetical protein